MADPDRSALDEARKRARRRLVGAIVLALAAAVVLPIFLETDPKPLGPDVQLQIPPIDDGKFQNRLTPEAKASKGALNVAPSAPEPGRVAALVTPPPAAAATGNGAAQPSMQEPAKATAQPAKAMPPEPIKAPAQDPTKSVPQGPVKAPAQDAAKTAAEPPRAAAGNPAERPPAAGSASPMPVATTAPGASPASVASPASAPGNAGTPSATPNGTLVVQLGAFVGLPIAVELADKAREQGFPVFLEKVTAKSGPVHRVRVGPYGTIAEAQADAVKLKLAGFTADVRKR